MISRRDLFGVIAGMCAVPFAKAEELPPLTYWQDDVDWDEVERDYQAMKERQSSDVEGWYPVQVRWYNRARGFGYVEPVGGAGKIFLSGQVVKLRGWETVKPGQTFWVHWRDWPKGRTVVQIMRWAV